ncbi:unnamed protein product, partial [marine sediment metagenome]
CEQWANLGRVRRLARWWFTGSQIINKGEYGALFEWIASFETHTERTMEAEG